ncbi:hypothetical protein ACJMK2_030669 [Sinanodonta woodiana]|uniref:COMM domain-containing protein 5 n=1 Tax=Sinanodonta woodiana TaxID=1069815 RepID=A0ABD3WY59_SINWO
MSIVQVVGSGGSVAADRTPFYGARLPNEVKSLVKPLSKLDKQVFRKILQLIVSDLEGSDIENAELTTLETKELNEETLFTLYMGLHTLLQCALRHPLTSLKQEAFKEDLQDLQVPKEFHSDLASVVFGSRRPQIESNSLDSRPRLPQLENLKWRVDVAISTSVLNRVLDPAVFMEMTLSNGKIHSFEVPVSKFQELRYNVAYVLKEMEDLEKRSILKIQD